LEEKTQAVVIKLKSQLEESTESLESATRRVSALEKEVERLETDFAAQTRQFEVASEKARCDAEAQIFKVQLDAIVRETGVDQETLCKTIGENKDPHEIRRIAESLAQSKMQKDLPRFTLDGVREVALPPDSPEERKSLAIKSRTSNLLRQIGG
jgi:chromosome segregation ATPase